MKYLRFQLAAALCLLAVAALAAGCASRTFTSVTPPAGAVAGTWTFRHAVTLDLPDAGMTLPFTGIMRCNVAEGRVHAVALSGMGLTFMDMTVDAEGHTVRFIHPSLARLPHAAENAAAAIRYLWLGKTAEQAKERVVSRGEFSDGWAREIILAGERFVLRVTLLESRRET